MASLFVEGVLDEFVKRHELERGLMCGGQADLGGYTGVERLFPTGGAKAPAIAGLEAGEVPLWTGGDEIVAAGEGEGEEVVAGFDADGVDARVLRTGVTAAVTVKPGEGGSATGLEDASEDVQRSHSFY